MLHMVMVMMVVTVMMMVARMGRGRASRQAEHERRGERQGHEFQSESPCLS